MAKQGFNGQWVVIARVGKFVDSKGVERDLTPDFFNQVVTNYNNGDHDAPATIGHPVSDTAPAYGWTLKNLKFDGKQLLGQFADTNDDFEEAVARGAFKKRSGSFLIWDW